MQIIPAVDPSLRSAFLDFARNGRWGTCAFCPQDGLGNALPELCPNTGQSDHGFDVDQLAGAHKAYRRDMVRNAIKAVLRRAPADLSTIQGDMNVGSREIFEVLKWMMEHHEVIKQGSVYSFR